ncbi:MAG TPA: TonB-dependent receptor [Gemmatimonadales bacterium]|nr:TonB-dependent receptor [Gemmatimonadales bacterium]
MAFRSARRTVARRVLLILLAFGAASAAPLAAQQRVVSGSVRDARTREAVAEAQVFVPGTALSAWTDEAGRFQLSVPVGPVELRVRRIGFLPVTRLIAADEAADRLGFLLEAAPTELAPMVVTATRDARSLADVPAAVSVADSTVLNAGRTAGLHEVLRYAPGVQANSRYGLDDVNISIRGSGIRSSFGVRGVAVVLDGVPITEPDGQTRLDLVELASARQVEVLRGPASALYGGAASGGAVNIISRSGAESRGLTARALGGTYGFRKYDGSYGAAFGGGRGAVFASGTWTDSDGFRAHNTDRIWRLNLRSEYAVAEHSGVALEASTSDLDMKIPGNLTLDEFRADPNAAEPRTVANDYGRVDQRWRAGLRGRHVFGGGSGVEGSGYVFLGGRELDHPIFQVVRQDLARAQAGARVRAPLLDGRLSVTAGGDLDRLAGSDQRFVNSGGEAGDAVSDADITLPTVGLYAQAEGRVTGRLTLTGGIRWDRVHYTLDDRLDAARSFDQTWSELSPKATAAYRVGASSSIYLSVARGFEPPTLSELTTSPDPAEAFNTGLEPQRLVNYEVGYKTLLRERLFLDLALFRTDIEGEFLQTSVFVPGETAPRRVYVNAGDSRHVGFEAGVRALLTDRVDLVGSYTWSDFVLQDYEGSVVQPDGSLVTESFAGNRLPGVPAHRLTGELRLRPVDRLSASVGAEWQSRVFVDNGNTDEGEVYVRGFGPTPTVTAVPFRAVDAYALVHVGARWTTGPVTLHASVENLLDQTYAGNVATNAADGRFYSAGAGRYLSVGMTIAARGGVR